MLYNMEIDDDGFVIPGDGNIWREIMDHAKIFGDDIDDFDEYV